MNGKKADEREPGAPFNNIIQILQVQDPKNEDKFQEYKIPELVLDMLV